jgi:molybdate transport system ATP-binding protein
LRDINLAIKSGEHWAVLGPNGAGKSTLLKLIVGDLHPAWGGRVRRFEFTSRNTIWEVKRRIGSVSPELQSNYRDNVTGLEAIASGFTSSIGVMLKPTRGQFAAAARLAERLGLRKLARKSVLAMSYGELRRVLIARALVHRPDLLICDEPYDGLDAAGRGQIAALLETVAASGTTLVLVTHHAGDLPVCLTHVIELNAGRVVFQGALEQRTNPVGAP